MPIVWGAWSWVLGADVQAQVSVPIYGYQVVHTYPHDIHAFTEGLFYLNGFLYESTGLERQSSIRRVRLETGEVVQKIDVPAEYFGEGIVNWKAHLVSLPGRVGLVLFMTWRLSKYSEGSPIRARGGR